MVDDRGLYGAKTNDVFVHVFGRAFDHFMSSSQMVSTDKWNKSVVLTTRQRQTPPLKQRRDAAVHVAWLPVWWVSLITDAVHWNKAKYRLGRWWGNADLQTLHLFFRTPSRASRWFCFGISTPSSPPGPLMGKKPLLLVINMQQVIAKRLSALILALSCWSFSHFIPE